VPAHFPALALEGRRVYVLWELLRSRARSRGLGYAVSFDGGRTFTPPRVVPGTEARGANGSQQGLLMRKLAVNAAGAIAVVHSALRPGRESGVWLIRGRAHR
jgi:hypothetical protein